LNIAEVKVKRCSGIPHVVAKDDPKDLKQDRKMVTYCVGLWWLNKENKNEPAYNKTT